jgi:hypothetical protein
VILREDGATERIDGQCSGTESCGLVEMMNLTKLVPQLRVVGYVKLLSHIK